MRLLREQSSPRNPSHGNSVATVHADSHCVASELGLWLGAWHCHTAASIGCLFLGVRFWTTLPWALGCTLHCPDMWSNATEACLKSSYVSARHNIDDNL